MTSLPQPADLASLVLRTDFTDEAAWAAVKAAVDAEAVGATFVSDAAYDGVSIQALVAADAVAEEDEQVGYLFVADATTMRDEERPLLAVDLWNEPGRTFRVPARWYPDVSANLSIGNMDFEEFADAVGEDGAYRGFGDEDD
ncbi:hypothetical protein OHA72_33035 [Dactylosporangium sp. NBC_01737]|uniref:DUF6924 domain-containing protein n=1 Tax=Dactylosporangium sp. NBC_01737 TaxID=2975959 RepID=UPI002E109FAB|nr:hypothetical protein OHA72_33035 [Dactylosporangium sp. NBC_01737]